MKIYLNRPIKKEAWGGGSHFITGFYEYLDSNNVNVVFDLNHNDIDYIFMFDPRTDASGKNSVNDIYQYKIKNKSTKIIQRINDTDIARPKDKPWRIQMLLHCNQIADHTIFISEWLKNHYIEKGFNEKKPHSVILNGCNTDFYYPEHSKKLSKGKIKIITHHWSDNFMKGFEVYNYLDQHLDFNEYEFTYLGRYNKEYTPKNIKIIPPKYGKEIGDILRSHDIYITGAQYEACGMHHIEAASCGLPVVYRSNGGGIEEISKNHGIIFDKLEKILPAIENISNNYDFFKSKINYNNLNSENCFKKYLNIVKN